MIKLDSGYWVPTDGEYGKRFFHEPLPNGLPSYNLDHIKACLSYCRDRTRVAIDVGAYLGTWTVHLAEHFDSVFAFEPAPQNFECLRRNVARANGQVLSLKVALHSEPTYLMMRQYREHHQYTWTVGDRGEGNEIKVVGSKLDQIDFETVDLIKINVCGHELEVVRGALNTIRKHRPCVIVSENYDPHRRACALLKQQGMKLVWENQRNYLFTWSK